MIGALGLLGGAIYGTTLLGTDGTLFGIILICLPAFFWRFVYQGLGRFVWVGSAVVLILFTNWFIVGPDNLSEMWGVFAVMGLFPLMLMLGFAISKREYLAGRFRRLLRHWRS